jgi:two-component system sensor histidine kinase SaeS
MTKPIEKSLRRITLEAKNIAEGTLKAEVPITGPREFRYLAEQFNEMSSNLQQSFHQIQSAEAQRRELVANVSHDLRTPLASIRSFVEALQDDVVKDEETFKRYLLTIQSETMRLSDLIQDLFDLSTLEAATTPYTPQPTHVDSLILQKLQSLSLQLEAKQLNVKVLMPDDVPPVLIVSHQIQRVLANLLENAIRHSPQQGTITLHVRQTSDAFVQFIVEDEGEGIEEDQLEAIFQRFYRIDASRNRQSGGAGLGLAIAKSIIAIHGGEIGAESVQGKGSQFWFTLPIAQAVVGESLSVNSSIG